MQDVRADDGSRGPAGARLFPLWGVVLALAVSAGAASATAGDAAPHPSQPGTIVTGSPDVSVGNHPAARQGDQTATGAAIVSGSSNVFINGKPAVTSGTTTTCNGIVIGSSANVFVNGKPLAGEGDPVVADCPRK